MSSENTAKVNWFGQFVLYLVLFALAISAAAYFWWGSGETIAPPKTIASETPKPAEAPTGVAGHDAPRATP